jgi:hypothetical protein
VVRGLEKLPYLIIVVLTDDGLDGNRARHG